MEFDNDAREWFRQAHFPLEKLIAPPAVDATVRARAIDEVEVEIARRTVAVSGPARSGRAPSMGGWRAPRRAAANGRPPSAIWPTRRA